MAQDVSETSSEFLATPPWLAFRGLLWLILLLLAAGLAWAFLARVDVVVTARGVLRTEQPAVAVMTTVPGRVLEVRVEEGQKVGRDQVLLVLDSRTTAGEVAEVARADDALQRARLEAAQDLPLEVGRLEEEMRAQERQLESLQVLSGQLSSESSRLRRESASQSSQAGLELERSVQSLHQARLDVEQARRSVKMAEEVLARHRRLAAKGLVSQLQVLELENRYQQSRTDLAKLQDAEAQAVKLVNQRREAQEQLSLALEGGLAELERRREELAIQEQSCRARLAQSSKEAELARNRSLQRVSTARSEARKARAAAAPGMSEKGGATADVEKASGHILLRATTAGTVASLKVRNPGVVVSPGDPLMRLLPLDSPLIVEATFANRDVGRIRPGLPIKLKLDAFPHQKYGVLRGEVTRVSPDAEPDPDQGYVYRVECRLARSSVSGEGRQADLFPGLAGEVQVVTREERVLELIFKPFRELGQKISVED